MFKKDGVDTVQLADKVSTLGTSQVFPLSVETLDLERHVWALVHDYYAWVSLKSVRGITTGFLESLWNPRDSLYFIFSEKEEDYIHFKIKTPTRYIEPSCLGGLCSVGRSHGLLRLPTLRLGVLLLLFQ